MPQKASSGIYMLSVQVGPEHCIRLTQLFPILGFARISTWASCAPFAITSLWNTFMKKQSLAFKIYLHYKLKMIKDPLLLGFKGGKNLPSLLFRLKS